MTSATKTVFLTSEWADLEPTIELPGVITVRATDLTVAVIAADNATQVGVTTWNGDTYVVSRPYRSRLWHGSVLAADTTITLPEQVDETETDDGEAETDLTLLLVGITTSQQYIAATAGAPDPD